MERSEFLKLCQRVSVLPDGVMHTKRVVPSDLLVEYENRQYYPEYLEIKFENGQARNIAVLHELQANCRLCVPLESVELTKQD
jgi:hypothetical protein